MPRSRRSCFTREEMIQSALLDDRFRDLVDEGRATWNASDVLKLYTETKSLPYFTTSNLTTALHTLRRCYTEDEKNNRSIGGLEHPPRDFVQLVDDAHRALDDPSGWDNLKPRDAAMSLEALYSLGQPPPPSSLLSLDSDLPRFLDSEDHEDHIAFSHILRTLSVHAEWRDLPPNVAGSFFFLKKHVVRQYVKKCKANSSAGPVVRLARAFSRLKKSAEEAGASYNPAPFFEEVEGTHASWVGHKFQPGEVAMLLAAFASAGYKGGRVAAAIERKHAHLARRAMPENLGNLSHALAIFGEDPKSWFRLIFSGGTGSRPRSREWREGADPMKNLLGYSSSVPSLIKVLWGAAVLSKLGEHRDSVKVAWSTMVYALKNHKGKGSRVEPWPLTVEDEGRMRDIERVAQCEGWGDDLEPLPPAVPDDNDEGETDADATVTTPYTYLAVTPEYAQYIRRGDGGEVPQDLREILSEVLASMGLETTLGLNALPSSGSSWGGDARADGGDILAVDVAHTTGMKVAFLLTSEEDTIVDPVRDWRKGRKGAMRVSLNGRARCKDRLLRGLGWKVIRLEMGELEGQSEETRKIIKEKLAKAGIDFNVDFWGFRGLGKWT